eukprot:GCRY01003254.1.p1 GENE.GCRY01003254.1~~GCRY01003254.1.p1  ORF type:complete len:726 (+),score=180.58 GCRY01003254.1:137-2314(+)
MLSTKKKARPSKGKQRTLKYEDELDRSKNESPHSGLVSPREYALGQRKEVIKPKDQLELTEEDLSQEFTRLLNCNNPNAPSSLVRFNHKQKAYVTQPSVDQTEVHFELPSLILHRSSEEGKKQLSGDSKAAGTGPEEKEEENDEEEEESEETEELQGKPLRNQFNFSDRASQCSTHPPRERGTMTEPPLKVDFNANVTQYEIFDAYIEHQERQKSMKDKGRKGGREKEEEGSASAGSLTARGGGELNEPTTGDSGAVPDVMATSAMGRTLKIMERMVSLNIYDDVALDYMYWEDKADLTRTEGSLLPLWRFFTEAAKRKHVTSVKWNPLYQDMFVVGYGRFDFLKQGSGGIAVFSLKSPTHPEYFIRTASSVLSVDVHPQHPNLIIVGLYSGVVQAYDLKHGVDEPLFQCTVKTGKHTDPVWQVVWQAEDFAKDLSFISVSSDGRITSWAFVKNTLEHMDLMKLKVVAPPPPGEGAALTNRPGSTDPEAAGGEGGLDRPRLLKMNIPTTDTDSSLLTLAGGTCIDFNKLVDHLFLVGTEEGAVHKCSKAYSSQYLASYFPHSMAVYGLRWNPFSEHVFLTCSADWSVKLYDHRQAVPLLVFDLPDSVSSVAWAPYSAAVFACAVGDGSLYVFDLLVSKTEPMCVFRVTAKSRLTQIAFNPHHPIILVGDERGIVHGFKLSPNLRKSAKFTFSNAEETKTYFDEQKKKMDEFLSSLDKPTAVSLSN